MKMKKCKTVLIAIILIALVNSNSYSQQQEHGFSSGLCVKKYDIIIDGYYGYPYLMGILVKKVLADSFGITKALNINHIGARFEYMVWSQIGLGLEYTYALLSIDYQGKNGKYYTAGVSKQRFLGKFNYHFATSEKLDPYLTAGIGYSNTNVFSNEPGVKSTSVTTIPIALRVGIGLRYFFTETIGINAEVGLGGPLMQAGMSFKF